MVGQRHGLAPAGGGMNKGSAPMDAPRVGIWITDRPLQGGGGAERRFARMVAHLRARENPPPVQLILTERLFRELVEEVSIPVPRDGVIFVDEPVRSTSEGVWRMAFRRSGLLRGLCRDHRLDVVHLLAAPYFFFPFLLGKPRGLAVVFSLVAHPYLTQYEHLSWKAKLALHLYLWRADAVDSLYFGFADRFPRYADKSRTTPCAFTDYDRYVPADHREPWMVFSGRFDRAKNAGLFLEAVQRIAGSMREGGWKAFLLGGGHEEPALRDYLHRFHLDDIVEMKAVPDTSPILARASIVLSLQERENYPSQSLLEAMASGNAVIATDVGDTRRLVQPDRGMLLERQTPEALSDALLDLMRDPERRAEMGRRARAFVVEHHTVERAADHLLEVWKLAAARRRGGRP